MPFKVHFKFMEKNIIGGTMDNGSHVLYLRWIGMNVDFYSAFLWMSRLNVIIDVIQSIETHIYLIHVVKATWVVVKIF